MSLVKLNGSHIKPEVQNPGKSLGEQRRAIGMGERQRRFTQSNQNALYTHCIHIRNSQWAKSIKRKKKIKNTVGLHSGSKIV